MHPEVQELQSKLKEILYDCAVDIRASKAALYLLGSEGKFELVTEYGFRNAVRATADRNDPVIDRCGRGRTPFFVNGLNAEPRFSHIMFESASDRLLAAPVYLRGTLVGVIDMRDKGGKSLFDNTDLPKAQKIADRIGAQFANKNVFAQRFITLSDAPEQTLIVGTLAPVEVKPLNPKQPLATPAPSRWPAERPKETNVPRLATLIIESRSNAERILVPESPESISERELASIRDMLRAILLIPGAVLASVSAFGHLGGVQEVAARSSPAEEALKVMQSKLNLWLTKRGDAGGPLRTNITLPFGNQEPPVTAAQIQKVFTAPVAAGSLKGIYLTIAFPDLPDRVAHELLSAFHAQLQSVIEHSMSHRAMQSMRARVAAVLIEPDFTTYPELRRHSEAVASRVETFARFLSLTPAETANARLTALVHDVGMRLLDYENLYRKSDVSQDELLILKEHCNVGAAIVEPLLGNEIARAVLCHHERWDGAGYPNEMHGSDIPMTSRIVQLCDAYETMIAVESYAAAESLDQAAAKILRGAGTQFDPELTKRFIDMLRARVT